MNVDILESKTGKLIGQYPIVLQGLNYKPTKEEYIALAWHSAVEDKLVNANDLANYTFNISE